MKRLCVAGIIRSAKNIYSGPQLLLGKRGKDPNRGLYVFPGGGVEENESLEQAFCREILEETGMNIADDFANRWNHVFVVDLPDRIILVAHANIDFVEPISGSDLTDVAWFSMDSLPDRNELSPVIIPVLKHYGYLNFMQNNVIPFL